MNGLYSRSDLQGAKQIIAVIGCTVITGATTVLLWRYELPWLAAVALLVHGNLASLTLGSAVHDLSHNSLFRSRWLNKAFIRLFSLLAWQDIAAYWENHKLHHKFTLQDNDPDRIGACRELWLIRIIASLTFNLPKLILSLWFAPCWILAGQALQALVFLAINIPELIVVATLAPFFFNTLEILFTYTQHAGLPLGEHSLVENTRSIKLPWPITRMYWFFNYHLEHHLYPAVPCYHLPELQQELGESIPKPQTLWAAWKFIWKNRTTGNCGGPIPKIIAP